MVDFGSDISTLPDLDPNLGLVTGNTAVAEACYRRLMTPRGSYSWDPTYGLYIRGMLNETMSDQRIATWQREIANELEKDERVLNANATITRNGTSIAISIEILTANGPFSFVLGVSSVTVSILQPPP